FADRPWPRPAVGFLCRTDRRKIVASRHCRSDSSADAVRGTERHGLWTKAKPLAAYRQRLRCLERPHEKIGSLVATLSLARIDAPPRRRCISGSKALIVGDRCDGRHRYIWPARMYPRKKSEALRASPTVRRHHSQAQRIRNTTAQNL